MRSRYDRRVQIQRATEATAADHSPTSSWVTTMTVWASVKPLKAEERIEAARVTGLTSHLVCMRYNPDVKASDRLQYGDLILHVEGVVQDGSRRHGETKLTCVEIDEGDRE